MPPGCSDGTIRTTFLYVSWFQTKIALPTRVHPAFFRMRRWRGLDFLQRVPLELGGRLTGKFLECRIEGGFGIEPRLVGNTQHVEVAMLGRKQKYFRLRHAIAVDKLEKALAKSCVEQV